MKTFAHGIRVAARRLRALREDLAVRRDLRRNLRSTGAQRAPRGTCSDDFVQAIEIVVPCYNHAMHLPEAYESVRSQTWRDALVTVTLIDDASTDETPRVIAALASRTPEDRIRLRTLRNDRTLRQWGSLNRAIATSESQLFVILNDDDLLVPDCLAKIVETYRRHPQLGLLGASSIWFRDGDERPPHVARPIDELELTIHTPHDALRYRRLNDLNMTHSSCSFRRWVWEAVGGYRPRPRRVTRHANEDRDFQMRVSGLCPVGVYRDYPLAWWRSSSSHGKGY